MCTSITEPHAGLQAEERAQPRFYSTSSGLVEERVKVPVLLDLEGSSRLLNLIFRHGRIVFTK